MTSFNATGCSSPLRTSPNEWNKARPEGGSVVVQPSAQSTRRRAPDAARPAQLAGLRTHRLALEVHLLAVASQSQTCCKLVPMTAVVPAYRCGTVPDFHRVPSHGAPGISAHRSMPPTHMPLANQLRCEDYRVCPRSTTTAFAAGSRPRPFPSSDVWAKLGPRVVRDGERRACLRTTSTGTA